MVALVTHLNLIRYATMSRNSHLTGAKMAMNVTAFAWPPPIAMREARPGLAAGSATESNLSRIASLVGVETPVDVGPQQPPKAVDGTNHTNLVDGVQRPDSPTVSHAAGAAEELRQIRGASLVGAETLTGVGPQLPPKAVDGTNQNFSVDNVHRPGSPTVSHATGGGTPLLNISSRVRAVVDRLDRLRTALLGEASYAAETLESNTLVVSHGAVKDGMRAVLPVQDGSTAGAVVNRTVDGDSPTTPPPHEPEEEVVFEPHSPHWPPDNGPHPSNNDEGYTTPPPSPYGWPPLLALIGELGLDTASAVGQSLHYAVVEYPNSSFTVLLCCVACRCIWNVWSGLTLNDAVMWRVLARNELTLGLPRDGQPVGLQRVPLNGDMEVLYDYVDSPWRNEYCWRHNLVTLLRRLGFGPHALLVQATSTNRRARLTAGRELLEYRDLIFNVRARVFNNLARETVREDNAMNRAVINREVLNVIRADRTLQQHPERMATLIEVIVASCFIDTVYDEIGREVAFGPTSRPL